MSDLSRLLDDVYGGPGAPVDTTPPAPAAPLVGLPDWAMDSVLDDAFADWVPGPATVPVDAVAPRDTVAPRDALAPGHAVGPVDAPADRVERAPGTPRRSAFSDAVAQPAPVAAEVPVPDWCRGDDDILPVRRTKGSKRSRAAAADDTAPSIEMFAAVEDQAPPRRGRLTRRAR